MVALKVIPGTSVFVFLAHGCGAHFLSYTTVKKDNTVLVFLYGEININKIKFLPVDVVTHTYPEFSEYSIE